MFCSRCGNQIEPDALFCKQCGEPTAQAAPKQPEQHAAKAGIPPPMPPAAGAARPRRPKKPVNKKALWIGIGAAAVIAVVLVLLFAVILPGDGGADVFLMKIEPMGIEGRVSVSMLNWDISMGDITTTMDGEEYGMLVTLDEEDLMDRPVSLAVEQRDETGRLLSRGTVDGLMVIDTAIEDDVDWDDYRNCKTLYVNDSTGDIDLRDIAQLKNVTTLYLYGCTELEDLDDLKDMPQLVSLYVRNMDVGDLGGIGKLPRLQNLVIDSNAEDLDMLEGMTSLKALWLQMPKLKDMDALEGMRGIEYLQLSEYRGDFDVLEGLTGLQTLELSAVRGDMDDLKALEGMTRLESLSIYNFAALEDIDALEELGALKKLKLSSTHVRDLDVLGKMPGLEALTIYRMPECDDFDVLEDMLGLRILSLVDISPGDIGFLEGMDALEYLYLNDIWVDDEDGARDVLEALEDRGVEVKTGAELFALAEETQETPPQATQAPAATEEPAPTAEPEPEPVIRIAVCVPSMDNEFCRWFAEAVIDTAAERYPDVELRIMDCEFDPQTQMAQVEAAVASGTDAVILLPANVEMLMPTAQIVHDLGVPIVAANAPPGTMGDVPVVYSDADLDGETAAQALLEYLAAAGQVPEGKLAMLHGMGDIEILEQRSSAFAGVFDDFAPDLEIAYVTDIQLDAERALAETQGAISTFPDLAFIFSDTGVGGEGAAQALEEADMTGKVMLVTFDASSKLFDYLRAGAVDVIVAVDVFAMADASLETVMRLVEDGAAAPATRVEPLIVDSENVDAIAERMGY